MLCCAFEASARSICKQMKCKLRTSIKEGKEANAKMGDPKTRNKTVAEVSKQVKEKKKDNRRVHHRSSLKYKNPKSSNPAHRVECVSVRIIKSSSIVLIARQKRLPKDKCETMRWVQLVRFLYCCCEV